jgi:hypothetical protein
MFCTKCGSQINAEDQYCPKCGGKNENYKEKASSQKTLLKSSLKKGHTEKQEIEVNNNKGNTENIKIRKKNKIVIPIVIVCCAAIVIIGIAIIPKLMRTTQTSKIMYSPRDAYGYSGKEGDAYFIKDGKALTFKGEVKDRRTTPDRSKYLILFKDESLSFYNDPSAEGTKVAGNVFDIGEVNNDGCFYKKTYNDELYYYDFASGEVKDIGFDGCDFMYSSGNKSVVGFNEENELFLYKSGDTEAKDICNMGADATVCGVTDDGNRVIWYSEEEDAVGIYMIKENGIPERIGKIENPSEYFSARTQFFDDGKSFIIYSFETSQLWMSINGGEVQEISLPGAMTWAGISDINGLKVDSDDDSMTEFYFTVLNNKGSNEATLYRMTKKGELKPIVSDMGGVSFGDYYMPYNYYFINGNVYYLNSDNDFVKAKCDGKSKNKAKKITTKADNVYIPQKGDYAYIIKSGSLYYLDLSDKSNQLNLITNEFGKYDALSITDMSNRIYYITDMKDIEDTSSQKGTLYSYTVGGETEKLADDIMEVKSNDSQEISATSPIFKQYVSHEDAYSIVTNIGTLVDGKYKNIIENVAN